MRTWFSFYKIFTFIWKVVDRNLTVQQAYHQNFENLCIITWMAQQRALLVKIQQLQGILRNHPPLSWTQDEVEWSLTSTKEFTVKSLYRGLKGEANNAIQVHKVWKMKVLPRMKVFAWLDISWKYIDGRKF